LKYPQVREALEKLGGRVSADEMRRMNYAADAEHRDVKAIVADFLRSAPSRTRR
jgi:glycine betaine/choline ABC-type transport system substrate-binding protein